MLQTLKPWMIIDPAEYAHWVENNILKAVTWKKHTDKFRVSFQKLFGEDRLTRYVWMVTSVSLFWLIYSYQMKTTIRDLFGCDSQEAKNLKLKYLMPKISTNLASVNSNSNGTLETFDKLIINLMSLRMMNTNYMSIKIQRYSSEILKEDTTPENKRSIFT